MSMKYATAGGVAVGAIMLAGQQALPPKTVEKPTAVTVAASRFAWPDLSDHEIAALGARVKWLGKTKVQIFCDGADCRDLQTSIDNAFEDAGISSKRAMPFDALGYGFSILHHVGDQARAVHLANDIEQATGGRIRASVTMGIHTPDGSFQIAIGKKPRDIANGALQGTGSGEPMPPPATGLSNIGDKGGK